MNQLTQRIDRALEYLSRGGIIIVADDLDRENEGDFVCISELTTPDTVNFLITEGRGLVCQAITATRATELELPPMTTANSAQHQTNFTVSVDYLHGTTTGISTYDRATTIRALADPQAQPDDFGRPGHMFPLVAHPDGLSARRGHTEAAVELAALCGYQPNGVICEILNPNGTMARVPELTKLSERFAMPFITIEELNIYLQSLQNTQQEDTYAGTEYRR